MRRDAQASTSMRTKLRNERTRLGQKSCGTLESLFDLERAAASHSSADIDEAEAKENTNMFDIVLH